MTSSSLKGKVVWVTGSSRGIGAAIARAFAQEGAKVALHGRDAAALSAVSSSIGRAGGACLSVNGDVTRYADVDRMRTEIEAKLGPIDVVVANAGGSFFPPGPIEEIPEDAWRAGVDGNLTATFFTIKAVLPGMKQRKSGNIITL